MNTVTVLKWNNIVFNVVKRADGVANSVDPHQTALKGAV